MQIDVTDAQLIKHENEVHVMGQMGQIVLKGQYAETVWAFYQEQLKTGAGKFEMRFPINIEVEEPTGTFVHPDHPYNKL